MVSESNFENLLHQVDDICSLITKLPQAVSIATPNGTHYEITKAALNAGLHVVCEKPLYFTTKEALELQELAKAKNRVVGITYGYSGHQVIEQV